jgi:hypothetical protein
MQLNQTSSYDQIAEVAFLLYMFLVLHAFISVVIVVIYFYTERIVW